MSSEKTDQPGRPVTAGHGLERLADHGGARHLAEGADMRQARRAVTGLEDHRRRQAGKGLQRFVGLAGFDQLQCPFLLAMILETRFDQARDQSTGLFKRPCAAGVSKGGENGQ